MNGILNNTERNGRFTSSENFRLTTNGKVAGTYGAPFYSYVHEKNLERKLGRSLSLDAGNRSTKWGQFLEQRVHDLLPTSYELLSNVTMLHPVHGDIWAGSQDNVCKQDGVVADTKCYEPQNFAEYNDVLIKAKETGDLSEWKKSYAKEYWQLVSNACIWGFNLMEAILYMPYESELEDISNEAYNYDGDNPHEYRFIYESHKSKLAYLPDGNKHYKNLNIYRFEIPEKDKDFLTSRIIEAGKLLIEIK